MEIKDIKKEMEKGGGEITILYEMSKTVKIKSQKRE